jgi:biopolymer transport protein ExbD
VKADFSLALGNALVERDGLATALDAATGGKKDTRVFLRADRSVDYGEFMAVMEILRAAGYLKVVLVGVEQVGRR